VIALMITRSSLAAALLLAYLGLGGLTALRLARRGHSLGLVASALLGWPLLASLSFGRAPEPRAPEPIAGPFAEAIARGIAGLQASLAVCAEGPLELASPTQLLALAQGLRQADERIAALDRMIAELAATSSPASAPYERSRVASLANLRAARSRAAAELDEVLALLLALRVQIGLHALSGPTGHVPLRERLAELDARVAALGELSSLDQRPSTDAVPMVGA
jgi:hypothetical protein